MKFKSITGVYFSPTGNTFEVTKHVVENLSEKLNLPTSFISYTLPSEREIVHNFNHDELVVFASPVYAGRLPNKILPYVQSGFKGDNTYVIPIVTFGNRNYDNALAELCGELKANNFIPFAACAMATEHVFTEKVAPDRPDDEDYKKLNDFLDKVCDYISNTESITEVKVPGEWPDAPYYRPLRADEQPANFLKVKPKTSEICDSCGTCITVCPVGSINADNPSLITGVCIKCQACIKVCHLHAKSFDDEDLLSHVRMLEENFTKRAEPEFFL